MDAFHTIWLLAKVNLLLALDRHHSTEEHTTNIQTALVNLFIDEELFSRIKDKFGPESLVSFQPFHPIQVLTLMKLVALEGAEVGGIRPDIDRNAGYRLGRCLMMASDGLYTPENIAAVASTRSITKRKLALQLQLGSSLEVSNPPAIYTSIVRSDTIFGEMLRNDKSSLKLRNTFEKKSGMAFEDYVDHILGVLTYYLTLDVDKLLDDPGLACLAMPTFFAKADRLAVEKFWAMELTTLSQLETSLRKPSSLKLHHDFIEFRRRPFLEVAERNAIPLHLGFVQEKLESGLFWSAFNSLSTTEERAQLFTDWGRLFESYVSQILSRSLFGSAESYVPFPQFADTNEEAFDGLILSGKYCVAMEYKGGFLNANAKYGESEALFVQDLDLKFGTGKGAGIYQLARKISAVFSEKPSERRLLKEIDTSDVRIVIPVLVVQDSFVSSELTASHLVDGFTKLKYRQQLDSRLICTFPLVLDVADIEILKPFLTAKKVSIIDCLIERVQMGSRQLQPFRESFRDYLRARSIDWIRDEETFVRFEQIMNRISLRFFGKHLHTNDSDEGD